MNYCTILESWIVDWNHKFDDFDDNDYYYCYYYYYYYYYLLLFYYMLLLSLLLLLLFEPGAQQCHHISLVLTCSASRSHAFLTFASCFPHPQGPQGLWISFENVGKPPNNTRLIWCLLLTDWWLSHPSELYIWSSLGMMAVIVYHSLSSFSPVNDIKYGYCRYYSKWY